MSFDLANLASYDSETKKFRAGWAAPPKICASVSRSNGDGKPHGELIIGRQAAVARLRAMLLDKRLTISFASAAYDLACAAEEDPDLLPLIFEALAAGRIHDVLHSTSLDAIYWGTLGIDPRTGLELRRPDDNRVTKRYSLGLCVDLVLGRTDAKVNDVFRESYALFQGIDPSRWPPEASTYPINDSDNTWEVAAKQIVGVRKHDWRAQPAIPGVIEYARVVCRNCDEVRGLEPPSWECPEAAPEPHRNAEDLAFQTESDFCLKINAAHAFRTDPEKIAALSEEVEAKHAVAVERFQKKGWIRENGSECEAAVKRSIAIAYGVRGACPRCSGGCRCRKCNGTGQGLAEVCKKCGGAGVLVGRIEKIEEVACRGLKVKGRYQGCKSLSGECGVVCGNTGKIQRYGGDRSCENVFNDAGEMVVAGCDGTGLNLASVGPRLPRTDKLGVKTSRDTKLESGDDDMADYGEDEFEKVRTTYLPYLAKGIKEPLWISPNAIVASGRCSYENCPIHQFSREGGERNCIRARGAWCGYPWEMVLGSTDYSAGELCTLSQYTNWLFGYSQMLEEINTSGDPGILHSALGAQVLNIPLNEFLRRLEADEKFIKLIRQSMKPINFGKPAAMGSPKIVLTSRAKNNGFTVCENGPMLNRKGQPGYWGIRFCITVTGAKQCGAEKITEWHGFACPPVCKACVDVVHNILTPAYFKRFPEISDYHRWGKLMIKKRQPAPNLIWDEEAQKPRIVRERGFVHWDQELSALLNNGFQGMLADIGKRAYVATTRECFLGAKPDGSPSPLAGCRVPAFMHDEPVSELYLDTAYKSGPRIGEIMVETGRRCAPDVKAWKADTALAFWLDKAMAPKHEDVGGQQVLVPWGPIPEYLQGRIPGMGAALVA